MNTKPDPFHPDPEGPVINGLILAGGQSRRFGRDKAAADINGRTMIERVYESLSPLVDRVYVSVRPGGSTYGLPVDVVTDILGEGPLAGLYAGLKASPAPWLLVMACDVPFVSPDVLRSLVAECAPGVAAVVPETDDGRLQPLCACYHASVLAVVEAHLLEDRLAMHDLVRHLDPVRTVPFPAGTFRNINHPGDLTGADPNRRA